MWELKLAFFSTRSSACIASGPYRFQFCNPFSRNLSIFLSHLFCAPPCTTTTTHMNKSPSILAIIPRLIYIWAQKSIAFDYHCHIKISLPMVAGRGVSGGDKGMASLGCGGGLRLWGHGKLFLGSTAGLGVLKLEVLVLLPAPPIFGRRPSCCV